MSGTEKLMSIFDIVDARKNHTLECDVLAGGASEVFVLEHAEELQEHLVVAALVHFVDEQHDPLVQFYDQIRDLSRKAFEIIYFVLIFQEQA
jgi:hypothetical protein